MKNPLHIILCFLTVACMSTQPARAWQIEKHADEMTDQIYYAIYTTGTVVRINELVAYTPQLQIRLHPKMLDSQGRMLGKFEALFAISIECLTRKTTDVTTRFDSLPPKTETWTTSTERHGAFSPDPSDFVARLKSASSLRVRYTTTLGDIRTTKFDLANLTEQLERVKTLYNLSCHQSDR